jgi:hypothetical protein
MMRRFVAAMLGMALLCTGFLAGTSVHAAGVSLKVLDPRAERWSPPAKPIQPRLSTLDGKKIAIMNNTKPGAAYLQPFIEKVLKEKYPNIEFKEFKISYNAYPNKTNELKEIAGWADGVIAMLGD